MTIDWAAGSQSPADAARYLSPKTRWLLSKTNAGEKITAAIGGFTRQVEETNEMLFGREAIQEFVKDVYHKDPIGYSFAEIEAPNLFSELIKFIKGKCEGIGLFPPSKES